jgi:ribonuclease HII
MNKQMPNLFLELQQHPRLVAGIDEAGRGPLAGPVVAAAVIVNHDFVIEGINDSKKLSMAKREKLYDLITTNYTFGIGEASVQEIDEINILQATKRACMRAAEKLDTTPHVILVDGNMKFDDVRYQSIIKGDTLSISIAAASIIAKVHRDSLMVELAKEYPAYLWHKNSGYGTAEHIQAIRTYGVTKYHRAKFVRGLL